MSLASTVRTVEIPGPPAIPGLAFRHATPADWDVLAGVLNAARRADGLDEVRTGESLRSEFDPLDAFDVGRDVLVAEVDRRPVAHVTGILVAQPGGLVGETWASVHPDCRRRGLGTAMWRWTRDRLAKAAAADPRPGPRELRMFAMDVEAGCRAFAADLGYVPIRVGFEMRRSITGDLPVYPVPDRLQLRPVTPDQHRTIWDADAEAFRDHWGHREQTEGDYVARFADPDTDTGLWSVAWDGDEVAGSVMTSIYRQENEALAIRRGWLEHVSVRRPWRRRGLAKALCADALRVLRDAGMTEAWLGVDGSNPTGAMALYEALGFSVIRRWQAFGRPMDGPAPAGWSSEAETTA